MTQSRKSLKKAQKVVIKVGSSLLASLNDNGIELKFLKELVDTIAAQKANGRDIVLVSSGAVAAGCVELGLTSRPTTLAELQAAAAVGQCTLMQLYKELFNRHGLSPAQVLLTIEDLKNHLRFLNFRNTLRELLNFGTIPIINENDTVAIEELQLKMGDNDALAVSVAQLIDADAIIILSDVPGLYDRAPSEEGARLISHVAEITSAHFEAASGSVSGVGSGGMSSKLGAALGAVCGSIPLVIAQGHQKGIIESVLKGEEVGTFFAPRIKKTSHKRHWIAFSRPIKGKIIIDSGAEKALTKNHKSLLPVGIKSIEDTFSEGDTVSIYNEDNIELARGLSNYSSADAGRIIGKKSSEIEAILGKLSYKTLIHVDNLVIL